jgi:glutamate N-acetyltransferase/amino-acid N-acetyltransferase
MSPAPADLVKSTSSAMANSELLPVAGVRLGTVSAGIKTPGRLDLVLLELCAHANVAATFTQNAFCAAPVQVAKQHLSQTSPRYLLVNTGNANAGTGDQGIAAALTCCEAIADAVDVDSCQVLPFSTGVIGEHLPVDVIRAAIPQVCAALTKDGWAAASEGILTTDTRPKAASRQLQLDNKTVTLTGIAKGAGMLRPNMATMLAYLATDAVIAQSALQACWQAVVEQSFNRITVDGDTSTNDAAILVATGAAGNVEIDGSEHPDYAAFKGVLESLALELAQGLVRDGEGASKFVTVQIDGGRSEQECLEIAYTIAHSPLVKTALFASDPNWGRLLAAIGRADVEDLNVERVEVLINDVLIAEKGCRAASYTEEQGVTAMAPTDLSVVVRLNRGQASATVWTSDFSYDYVRINAEYRT